VASIKPRWRTEGRIWISCRLSPGGSLSSSASGKWGHYSPLQDRSALSSVFSLLMLPLTRARTTLPPRGNGTLLLQWCRRRRLPYLCISLLIPFELITPRRTRPPSGRAQSCHWAARGRWPRSSPLCHTSSPSPLDTFTHR
jgi:hypothetical protein